MTESEELLFCGCFFVLKNDEEKKFIVEDFNDSSLVFLKNLKRGCSFSENFSADDERYVWITENIEYYISSKKLKAREMFDRKYGRKYSMDIGSSAGKLFVHINAADSPEEYNKASERFSMAEKAAGIGLWDLNPSDMSMHISPVWLESLGYDTVDEKNSLEFWRSIVHPHDLPVLKKTFSSYLEGELKEFEIEYRIMNSSGKMLWILDRGKITEYSDDMKPSRVTGIFADIDEKKKSREKLEELSLALEKSSSSIMICDENNLVEYVNPKFYEKTGYSEHEVMGKSFKEFRPYSHDNRIYKTIKEELHKNDEWKGEVLSRKKNGDLFWENTSLSVIRNENGSVSHVLRISEDISELKKAHAIAERFFELTLDLLCIFKFNGEMVKISNSWVDVLGFEKDEILNKHLMEFIHPDDFQKTDNLFKRIAKGERIFSFENRYRTKSGKYKWLSWNAIPSKYEELIFAAARDITYEKQIQENYLEIIKMEKEAAESKSKFFMNMTHEIRTPMNGIIGMINLLKKTRINEKQSFFVETLDVSAKSLMSVLNRIIDYAQMETGDGRINKVEFNFPEFIQELKRNASVEAKAKGLEFIVDFDSDIPKHLIGDVIKLNDIMGNLVSNAVKFTNSGFVRITARKITETEAKIVINFAVADSGIGIRKEDMKKIFKSFTQANDSITRDYGGTGLGLSLSSKLIKLLGGEIEVSSESGKGSVFEFMLEFDKRTYVAEDLHTSLVNRRINVLVAEDDKINQYVTEMFLKTKDWNVTIAENGLEVIKQIEQRDFDLILMDIKMPVLDGYRATEIIREKEKGTFKHVPIIAVTAYTLPGEKDKCFEKGMDGYISKPIDENLFFKVINDNLKKV